MKPFEYHWDDVGAPRLNKNKGDLYSVFKSCLITGYGSKASAGWKLIYDGFTSKGEQTLAFAVGDDKEQEIIYFLEDIHTFSKNPKDPSAKISIGGSFNEATNTLGDKLGIADNEFPIIIYSITCEGQAPLELKNKDREWHFYATDKFALFFYETHFEKSSHPYAQHSGQFIAFGAVQDLFGEFKPQLILGNKYNQNWISVVSKNKAISSGGSFYLPIHPFSLFSNITYTMSSHCHIQHNSGIVYHLPILLYYTPDDNLLPSSRLYVPSLLLSPSQTMAADINDEWLKIETKNGYKIATLSMPYALGSLSFDLTEWDNPSWLQSFLS